MGNTQSCCGGREKVEVTTEPKPKADTDSPSLTRAGSSNATIGKAPGDKISSDKPKLLRPQSTENVKVDAPSRAPTTSVKKAPVPVTPKTKLTPLTESEETASPAAAASASASPNKIVKQKSAFADSFGTGSVAASEQKKPSPLESKTSSPAQSRTPTASAAAALGTGGGAASGSGGSGSLKKKPERQLTGMDSAPVTKTSSTGPNGGPPPSASAGAAFGSLKRVPTPANGAVATPPSPARTIIGSAISEEPEPNSKGGSSSSAAAAASPIPSPASETKRLADAGSTPRATPSLTIDPSIGGHSRTSSTSSSIGTPKAEPTTPRTPTSTNSIAAAAAALDPEAEAAAAREREAKAAAAKEAQLKLKEERLQRERTESEAAAKAQADAEAKEKLRQQNAEIAKKERDAKFAAIAEEKKKAEEAERAQKAADEAKKKAMEDNPAAVTMADKTALLSAALTPKAGDSFTVEDFVKANLAPAPETVVSGNNSKMFSRVMTDKLPAAYKTLIDALCSKENAHVTSLSLTYCQLTDEFLVQLSAALGSNLLSALDTLNLESNQIRGVGVKALAAALVTNTSLRVIKLDNQKDGLFAGDARAAMISALEKNETVTNLGWANSGSVEERNTLDKHLQKNKARLRASSTPKAAKVAVDNPFTARMEAIRSNTDRAQVFELKEDVHRSQFMNWTPEQQQKWFTDLHSNTAINELRLSALQLKETVIIALLTSGLTPNKFITKLDLASNGMSENCVKALVDCLKANNTLREIRLSECKMTVRSEDAIMALAESGVNTSVTVLKMSFANKNAATKVEAWLAKNKKLLREATKAGAATI